jgi:hypothetical protein
MFAQHPGHLPHGFESTPQGSFRPVIQEASRPGDALVLAEMTEALLEIPRPSRGQLALQQTVELEPRLAANPVAPPQQLPAHLLELGGDRLAPQPRTFGSAHLVHRLVQMSMSSLPAPKQRGPNELPRPARELWTDAHHSHHQFKQHLRKGTWTSQAGESRGPFAAQRFGW